MTIRITVSEMRPSGHRIGAYALEYTPMQSQQKSLRELKAALEKFMEAQEGKS